MQIAHVDCQRLDLSLTEPYTIAYETVDRVCNFVLRIETTCGKIGWGCGAPDLAITKEDPEEFMAHFEAHGRPALLGSDPFTFERTMYGLHASLPGHASLKAMVDMALYDLIAREAGAPLYGLLGGFRDSIPTSITIGICSVEETLERAAAFVAQGFNILKIKGGLDLDMDVERMLKLRERFGPGLELRFDANQGFTPAQALRFVHETSAAELELLEQPTPMGMSGQMGEVTAKSHIPIMADESIRSLLDAFHLASEELIDMVNLKLMKVGGISQGLHINSVSRAAGLEVMVGCMDECALGISAGLHFALARPNVAYADLDGHLDIVDDPFQGLFSLQNGVLRPTDAPGLGRVKF